MRRVTLSHYENPALPFGPPPPEPRRRRPPEHPPLWSARVLLALYLVLLAWLAWRSSAAAPVEATLSLWDLKDPSQVARLVARAIGAQVLRAAWYLPLGILFPLALAGRYRTPLRNLLGGLLGWLLSVATAMGLGALANGAPYVVPGPFTLAGPAFASLAGAWVGVHLLAGERGRAKLLPKLAVLAVVLAIAAFSLARAVVKDSPLLFDPPEVDTTAKRDLVDAFKAADPRRLEAGETATLELSEQQLNTLLAWGLSLGSAERKARVGLDERSLSLDVSAALSGQARRYLNVLTTALVDVDEGVPSVRLMQLRVGDLQLPGWLLDHLSPLLAAELRRDPHLRPILAQIDSLRVEPHALQVTYGPIDLPDGFIADLLDRITGETVDEAPRVREYIVALLNAAPGLPEGEARFGAFIEEAFERARTATAEGASPVDENRAATLALGVLLGSPRLARMVGEVLTASEREALDEVVGDVTLAGREDWPRHFWLSAGLAVLSGQVPSDAIGLLKEELDARTGGSGFSFTDIAADRAGTTFAGHATADAETARRVQEAIASGFDADAWIPRIADLPEGLTDEQFQARYGGVGGAGYQDVMQRIESRIGALPGYQ